MAEGDPVIAFLGRPGRGSHAVVVCEVGETHVTVMDPVPGDHVAIELSDLTWVWAYRDNEGLLIGSEDGKDV